MDTSEKINDLAAAMVAAQGEITGAAKDSTNPHFRTKYADLSSVMEACKGALNRHGIAVLQSPAPSEDGTLAIDTVLMHKSGQWASGRTVIPLQKRDPQGYGSAMTYARRYSLAAMVGVCPEDDDGEGAMDPRPAARQREPQNDAPDLSDDKVFKRQLHAAFRDRGFNGDAEVRAVNAVLTRLGVDRVDDVAVADRATLIQNVADGLADRHKQQNGNHKHAPAGAGR